MPVYRGLKVSVISQYGAQALPEYSPSRIFDHKTLSPAPDSLPALLDSTSRTATVYIPILANSMFWFRYHVYVPHATYYYFKAYVNGNHLVSWGTGEADNFEGKVMFGLFENRSNVMPERQLLTFANEPASHNGALESPGKESLEIRVHRCKDRRLVSEKAPAFVDNFTPNVQHAGIECVRTTLALKPGGEVEYDHPTQRYEYLLIDPLDEPYAVFRWLPRTWQEIDQLDVASVISSPEARLSSDGQQASEEETHEPQPAELAPETQLAKEDLQLLENLVNDDVSPLRVPIYQASRSTMKYDNTHCQTSSRERFTVSESGSPKRHQAVNSVSTRVSSKPNTARPECVLEPHNELDGYMIGRLDNHGALLDSVVSHLRTAGSSLHHPCLGSPNSSNALQQYLTRRSSERTAIYGENELAAQSTDSRSRPLSWTAEIENGTTGPVMLLDSTDSLPAPSPTIGVKISDKQPNTDDDFIDGSGCFPRSPTIHIEKLTFPRRTFSLANALNDSLSVIQEDSVETRDLYEGSDASPPNHSQPDAASELRRSASISTITPMNPHLDAEHSVAPSGSSCSCSQVQQKRSLRARLFHHFNNSAILSTQSLRGTNEDELLSPTQPRAWGRGWKRVFHRQGKKPPIEIAERVPSYVASV